MSGGGARGHVARWWALGIGIVALVLVALLATRRPAEDAVASTPLLGHPAPPIAGRSLSGAPVSLAAMRGEFVVVNFYASWCPACRAEVPQLLTFLYHHPAGAKVAVLGVVFGDTAADAAAFSRSTGATWPSVPDPSGRLAIAYGVSGPPESFLVAPDGRVVARVIGSVTAASLDTLVRRALAEGA